MKKIISVKKHEKNDGKKYREKNIGESKKISVNRKKYR
jgi:hypothetical protein